MVNKSSNFSKRIWHAMRLNSISQQKLSEKTNINKGNISKYLNGVLNPKLDKIEFFANILNVSPIWLMGYDVPMHEIDTHC